MLKQHNNHLLVPVPKDLHHPHIDTYNVLGDVWTDEEFAPIEQLPPGKWSIVGKADSLTEEQWRGIVDEGVCDDVKTCPSFNGKECCGKDTWFNYESGVDGEPCYSSTESGLSLLKHHGLEPETTIFLKIN